ncbi:hypothetical protein EV291_14520 [Rhizobium sp. BK068]|nr:hypothetical protein EV291_14520 [Rhizobium sp. BK068]
MIWMPFVGFRELSIRNLSPVRVEAPGRSFPAQTDLAIGAAINGAGWSAAWNDWFVLIFNQEA